MRQITNDADYVCPYCGSIYFEKLIIGEEFHCNNCNKNFAIPLTFREYYNRSKKDMIREKKLFQKEGVVGMIKKKGAITDKTETSAYVSVDQNKLYLVFINENNRIKAVLVYAEDLKNGLFGTVKTVFDDIVESYIYTFNGQVFFVENQILKQIEFN